MAQAFFTLSTLESEADLSEFQASQDIRPSLKKRKGKKKEEKEFQCPVRIVNKLCQECWNLPKYLSLTGLLLSWLFICCVYKPELLG